MVNLNGIYPYTHGALQELYKVPVQYEPPIYTVYISQGYKRVFDKDTVPRFIKAKIAMANAATDYAIADKDLYELDMFCYNGSVGMGNTAWRASETMYIVILDSKQLNSLHGDWDNDISKRY
jgi:hypothetical protein